MKKFTQHLKKPVFFSFCLFFLTAGTLPSDEEAGAIQEALNRYYDSGTDGVNLRRFEINVTNTGFCKYKKYYKNGKTELFSFNLLRFKAMAYYGTNVKGELYLFTRNDDVIVQTHNDRKGDIDTMAMQLVIPLKQIEAEQLNHLADQFKRFHQRLTTAGKAE